MTSTLEDIFSAHRRKIIDSRCLKELGLALKQCTELELQSFFASSIYNELHLQLLKLYAACISKQYKFLFEGIQAETKLVSQRCPNNALLFRSDSQLLNHEFLLPFLQTVYRSVRVKLIWNLGKYMPKGHVNVADTLFQSIVGVWGLSNAAPLICQCSEELIKEQLPLINSLSTTHLKILARRFPLLALTYLEKNSVRTSKVTKFIVRATLPHSLNYCLTHGYDGVLSKSAMKVVLKKYIQNVLESPNKWSNILDKKIVHKMLKPELFTQFVSKWFLELEDIEMPDCMLSYLELLSPMQVSNLMSTLLQDKYGSSLGSSLEYWEKNESVLKLLDGKDRSPIAVLLDAQSKGNQWVTLMSCDKSIERIKNELRNEADAEVRASLVRKLMETVQINHDSEALEEVCQFVAGRYQNDKNVLNAFFEMVPDLLTVSNKTWSVVFALAHKFFDPNDWMTVNASKLYSVALKRDPDMYLEMVIGHFVANYSSLDLEILFTLKRELRSQCINLVFTKSSIESGEISIQHYLSQFLSVISKWNEASTPIVYANVNTFIFNVIQSKHGHNHWVLDFVFKESNGFDIPLLKSLLQKYPNLQIIRYHLSKRLLFTNITQIGDKMIEDIFLHGAYRYVGVIQRMKNLGYIDLLQYLSEKLKDLLNNCGDESKKFKDAIFLLSLTIANIDDYFLIIDPLLPPVGIAKEMESQPKQQESLKGDANPEQLQETKHQAYVYKGIGLSFSHFDLPSLAVDRLLRFCVSGDLMLFVRDSLYSICTSLPNGAAQEVILSLLNKPVSVQKHALRLHRIVCNIQTQLDLLMNLLESEVHITTRTVLIQSAINCLNETRTVATWQVTREIMARLTPTDHSIVKWLVTAKVPDPFGEEYFKILLEKVKLLNDVSTDMISQTLKAICHQHTAISETFLENLFREYFLSTWYDEADQQDSLMELFMVYLKGITLSTVRSNLDGRRQFLGELVTTNATEPYFNIYDSKLCKYPGRVLFMDFIETFCRDCLLQREVASNETDMSLYIDILIDYTNKFDKSTLFESSVFLSLTQIVKDLAGSEPIGHRIGNFCDDFLRMYPSLTHYSVPFVMKKYFTICCLREKQLIPILFDLLPSGPVKEEEGILRLVIIGHILPRNWRTTSSFEPFKQMFLPLIKNTVVEVMMSHS